MKFQAKKELQPCKLNFATLFWLFIFGSVAGFIIEGIWHVMKTGHWESHVTTVWGPFCTIYGVAAALIFAVSYPIRDKNIAVQFCVYGGIGTAIEYFTSLFQELIFCSTSWNYDGHFLNLGGRVSLKMTLVWGLLGLAFVRFVFPYLSILLEKLQTRSWNIACVVCSVFMVVNLLMSAGAVMRWGNRMKAEPANNEWEEFLDRRFDDDRMQKTYPNMVFSFMDEDTSENIEA